ncbi:hypothetical protein ACUNGU_25040, partial [Serratia sp. IR-2025]
MFEIQAFSPYGYPASADVSSSVNCPATNGFYNTWSVMMLNVLIGNLSLAGGVFVGGGKFNGFA